MKIEKRFNVTVEDVSDEIELKPEEDQKLLEAIEQARQDHSETLWVDGNGPFRWKVKWNSSLEQVQVSMFHYVGGYTPEDVKDG